MSRISPDQWRKVSPYLDQALTLSGQQRLDWLARFRENKPELAAVVEELLEEQGAISEDGFLENNPPFPPVQPASAGEIIGPYRLLAPIGYGGMGTVWLAERSDGRFERKVAIKFPHIALGGRSGEDRFKREGSILGRLSHPHIAELVDAGVSTSGQPYLVLEYVDGEPIDHYCKERRLGLEARIRLFIDVLSSVALAHTHLIVHRDIKPSNVLVAAEGNVKLLDFGIAKLLEEHGQAGKATLLTQEGGPALTPEYAAPEQITGAAVTTATDVYSLGVLLYVLLTGQHPAGAGPHSPADMVKAIVETEPPPLSQAVASQAADGGEGGSDNSLTSLRLGRQLRGDLDTVVAKALKKNPEERYPSVAALADDLEHYLKDEPIKARPDSLAYRVTKFVHRNRTTVALVAILLMSIIAGMTASLLQARTARRQRDIAIRERDRANRIADFMTGLFKVSDPSERVGNSVTAREILDKASKDIGSGLSKDPALQAQMMHVMGRAYRMLGLQTEAQSLLERSIKTGSSALGTEDPEVLRTMNDLSWTLFQQGRLAEAERMQRRVIDIQQRVLGPDNLDTLGTMGQLANTLCEEGNCDEAVKLDSEVLQKKIRLLGPKAFDTLATMDNLSIELDLAGRFAEAEKLERQCLEIQVRDFGYENLGTINSMINLATIQRDMGKYEEAEKLFRQTLELEARVLGPDQPETAETKYNLACLLARRGQKDEALLILRQAVDHGLHPRIGLKIDSDPNLKALHGDRRFAALVSHARKAAARTPD
jgi:serine/threonine protein kinase